MTELKVCMEIKRDGITSLHKIHVTWLFLLFSGYKTLEVIKGNANAYVHTTAIKKWDICAGNAVLNTVGGEMTTLGGEMIDYSDRGSPLNSLGLLATANDHGTFLKSLEKSAEKLKADAKG